MTIPQIADDLLVSSRITSQSSSPEDFSNEEWLAALRGPDQDRAIAYLRDILLRGLRISLAPQLAGDVEASTEDFVQEALIKILKHLHTFRGESRFTTWAHKIAINVAFTELRRMHWQNISIQDLLEPYDDVEFTTLLTDHSASPEEKSTRISNLELIDQLIREELTERQRRALLAVHVAGMPLEEVARRMESNRNAMYKLIHDARRKLRDRLVETTGLAPDKFLDLFQGA